MQQNRLLWSDSSVHLGLGFVFQLHWREFWELHWCIAVNRVGSTALQVSLAMCVQSFLFTFVCSSQVRWPNRWKSRNLKIWKLWTRSLVGSPHDPCFVLTTQTCPFLPPCGSISHHQTDFSLFLCVMQVCTLHINHTSIKMKKSSSSFRRWDARVWNSFHYWGNNRFFQRRIRTQVLHFSLHLMW